MKRNRILAAAAAIAMAVAALTTMSTANAPAAEAANCTRWVYEVDAAANGRYITIWDSWSFNSDPVGGAFFGDRITSRSVGERFVRVDYLLPAGETQGLTMYNRDYVAKSGLKYLRCF